MRLTVVESAAQARAAVAAVPDATPLALTPEAAWELERARTPFHTDDELVSDEVFQHVCATSAPRAAQLAAALDELTGGPLDRPVFVLLEGELKRLLDAVLGRGAVLSAAFDALGADEILRFPPEPAPPSPVLDWRRTSPWAPVLPALIAARGTDAQIIDGPAARGVYAEHGLAAWQAVEAWPRQLARLLRERRSFRAGRTGRTMAGATAALVARSGPAVHEAAVRLAGEGARVIRCGAGRPVVVAGPLRPLRERLDSSQRRAVEDWAAEFRDAWRAGAAREAIRRAATLDAAGTGDAPADLSAPVTERLDAFVERWLVDFAGAVERAEGVLSRTGTELLIAGGTTSWPERRFKEAAQRLGIPAVGFQHGGGGYLAPEANAYRATIDLAGVGHYVAWGRGVVDEFVPTAPGPVRATVRPPRSLQALVGARVARPPADDPHVLFVPTNHAGDRRHGPAGDLPDTTNFRLQQRVAGAVLRRPGARVTVKLPVPDYVANPLPEWAAGRERCHVVQGGPPLTQMLGDADAVIVGWPFTVLLEAIATDLPVLCVADRRTVPLPAEPLALLRRRAIVVTDPANDDELAASVGELLDRAGQAPPGAEPDDAFLRRYGLGDPAGDWLAESLPRLA